MATFKPVIFTTKNHLKSDGTTNIKIRIYHNKSSQYISTPYYIEPIYFEKSGEISESNQNSDRLNYEIGQIVQNLRKKTIELGNNIVSKMPCPELKDYLLKSSQNKNEFIDFAEFAEQVISETEKRNTAEWYSLSLKSLQWFFNSKKINVRDITSQSLREYMKVLSKSGRKGAPLEPGAIGCYMRGLRSLFGKCKEYHNKEDFDIIPIPHNPFKRVKIPEYQRKRKNIPVHIIKQIRDKEFFYERQNIAKDMFWAMFCLMGINVNDLFNLKSVEFGRVEYTRSKTNNENNMHNFPLSIRIEPELQKIIDKYSEDYLFSKIHDRYSNSGNFMRAINKGLSQICTELNIPKITTNWARHSWASIARNKARIAKADVDFCLGHVSTEHRMADIYIEVDYGIFDDTNRKVLDLLQ